MRFALICAAAALATSSVCAAAEPAPRAPTATAKNAEAKKPRKVCKRDTSTGSTIPKKICRTVQEPAAQAKAEPAPEAHAEHSHDAGSTE